MISLPHIFRKMLNFEQYPEESMMIAKELGLEISEPGQLLDQIQKHEISLKQLESVISKINPSMLIQLEWNSEEKAATIQNTLTGNPLVFETPSMTLNFNPNEGEKKTKKFSLLSQYSGKIQQLSDRIAALCEVTEEKVGNESDSESEEETWTLFDPDEFR